MDWGEQLSSCTTNDSQGLLRHRPAVFLASYSCASHAREPSLAGSPVSVNHCSFARRGGVLQWTPLATGKDDERARRSAVLLIDVAVGKTPGELPGSVLRVGSENGASPSSRAGRPPRPHRPRELVRCASAGASPPPGKAGVGGRGTRPGGQRDPASELFAPPPLLRFAVDAPFATRFRSRRRRANDSPTRARRPLARWWLVRCGRRRRSGRADLIRPQASGG
jgi:hypothetical protein